MEGGPALSRPHLHSRSYLLPLSFFFPPMTVSARDPSPSRPKFQSTTHPRCRSCGSMQVRQENWQGCRRHLKSRNRGRVVSANTFQNATLRIYGLFSPLSPKPVSVLDPRVRTQNLPSVALDCRTPS
ncbi:hypothetical protein B0I37DRAFT_376571 [Chaetomium sp. MPI-CAGE-AT-0009]|nr:hypothetical protein B0I37DRAFT_376571 [Chaetomium sp. MPI-CAGE-AT-0009]